jgi:hypothetical protein
MLLATEGKIETVIRGFRVRRYRCHCTVDLGEIMTLIGYRMVIDATSVMKIDQINQAAAC